MNQDRASTITNSQLKEGYKQTEVGIIPEDWNQINVEEIAIKVGSGITPRGGSNNYKKYGRPFVRSQNVGWGKLLLNDLVYIDDEIHNTFASTELKQGDVLLNITGASIGRCSLANEYLVGGNVNQHVCIIRTAPERVSSSLLNYLFLSYIGQKQIDSFQAGGNREGLNFGQIRSIKFPLPPNKAEQEAIARTLSDIDALIESLDRLLTKKRQIKQGAMQELLRSTDGWVEYPFSEICWFQEGPGVRNHQFTSAGVKLFNGTNIEKGKIDLDKTNRYISEREAFGWYSHFLVDVGDIVIACSGISIDKFDEKVAIIDERHIPLCMNTSTMRFKVKQEILDKYYLLHFLRSSSFKSQIGGTATGSAQLNFGPSHVSVVKIQLPGLSKQIEIANILSDMDAEIGSIESKVTKTRQLKQGMIHELLTGRIRLVDKLK